jgi:hypothetical protein
MTDGAAEAVRFYREAARRHRATAAEHRQEHRPLNAAVERAAAKRISRAVMAEILDPEPSR